MKISWPKTIFPVIIKRKNCLPDVPDGDPDEVIHGTYVVAAPAICTLHTKKVKKICSSWPIFKIFVLQETTLKAAKKVIMPFLLNLIHKVSRKNLKVALICSHTVDVV